MSYTIPDYVDTKEQAVLALASVIADEDKTNLGNGSVNRALDVLADVLAQQDVQVPQTNAGAILALASYASGMVKPEGTIAITENGEGIDVSQYATADVSVSGGGGGDFTTAEVTIVNNTGGVANFYVPIVSAEYRMSGYEFATEDASATVTAAMYMGTAFATFNDVVFSVSATGDAEIDVPSIFITGDCTLTFTLAN